MIGNSAVQSSSTLTPQNIYNIFRKITTLHGTTKPIGCYDTIFSSNVLSLIHTQRLRLRQTLRMGPMVTSDGVHI